VNKKDKKKSSFEKFAGVYCSGFFIPNPSMVTTLCLMFDEIHLLNNLEYVIEFSRFFLPKELNSDVIREPIITSYDNDESQNPLSELNEQQLLTAKWYLHIAQEFILHYHDLFGEVIKTTLLPDNKVLNVELVKKGINGELNTYKVFPNPLIVTTDGLDQFNELIELGAVPVMGKNHVKLYNVGDMDASSNALASFLAMKSIQLVLPQMKATSAETILEARYKLREHLPAFWSTMLKLSIELKSKIKEGMPIDQMIYEGQEVVNTAVRPALIDLKRKLEYERKNWFHKILGPASNGVKMFLGNPSLSMSNLMLTGITMGSNIAIDFSNHNRKINELQKESGLIYLLKLDEVVNFE